MRKTSYYISREEHEEFKKRIEEWNTRQDERLRSHSETIETLRSLTLSIERLASNMENMVNEQASQGKRLQNLEQRDGETFRKILGYVATAVISILVGYILRQVGIK